MGQGDQGSRHPGGLGVAPIEDPSGLPFVERRPGYAKAVVHQDSGAEISVFRVRPGAGVTSHKHSRVHDFFVGMKGSLELHWDGGCASLKPGTVCGIPPGVRHEVRNRSADDAFFLLVHTPFERFDFEP